LAAARVSFADEISGCSGRMCDKRALGASSTRKGMAEDDEEPANRSCFGPNMALRSLRHYRVRLRLILLFLPP